MTDPDKTMVLAKEIDQTNTREDAQARSDYVEVEIGSKLASRYHVLSKLGEGGMGVVYAGRDIQLDRPVAIKLLKRNVSLDEKAVQKLKEEAQVSMMLTHPCIMRLINFEQDGGYAFLLMEYINGQDLRSVADRRPDMKLEAKTVAQLAYKVCQALEYAHKRNVIHRDIKPANIMVSSKKEVKLMDFGIAKVLVTESDEHPQIAGTLAYMAPEVLQGIKPDQRCDVYALGWTMYELLSGGLPFRGSGASDVIDFHLNVAPPPLGGVNRDLARIVTQCIEKRPNARYQSAQELRIELAKYLGLDEKDKTAREKVKAEHEKRMRAIERRKMERRIQELESDKERLERPATQDVPRAVADTGSYLKGLIAGVGAGFAFPLPLAGAAVAAGIVAVGAADFVNEGRLIEFKTVSAYETVSSALLGIIALTIPAIVRHGTAKIPFAAVLGAIAGVMGYSLGSAIGDYFIEAGKWGMYSMVTYLSMGFSFTAAVIALEWAPGKSISPLVRLAALVAAVTIVSAALPYFEPAETLFGFDAENTSYFYIPLVSFVVWVAVDMFARRLK